MWDANILAWVDTSSAKFKIIIVVLLWNIHIATSQKIDFKLFFVHMFKFQL